MNEIKTEIELINSTASKDLAELATTAGELVLDALLEGPAKDIPVFGCLMKMYGAGKEISNQLFLKKVINFLVGLSEATQTERDRFLEEINKNEKEKIRFGESIMLLLEKTDSMEKPQIIGKLISSQINGGLDASKAMRLCSMVNRMYLPDLDYLKSFSDGLQEDNAVAESLYNVGLISFAGLDGGGFIPNEPGGVRYSINEFGKSLLQFGIPGNNS